LLAAACAAVGLSGFVGGELLALPVSTPGGNVLPATQPLPGVYTQPMVFSTTNSGAMGVIGVGRDDTSPYATFAATFTVYGALPPYVMGNPYTFTYRPLWDPAVPILSGIGRSQIGEHWIAIDVFTQKLQTARTQSRFGNPLWSVTIWVDPTMVGTAGTLDSEFYKFDVTYN
jgi:hypothetical protein